MEIYDDVYKDLWIVPIINKYHKFYMLIILTGPSSINIYAVIYFVVWEKLTKLECYTQG